MYPLRTIFKPIKEDFFRMNSCFYICGRKAFQTQLVCVRQKGFQVTSGPPIGKRIMIRFPSLFKCQRRALKCLLFFQRDCRDFALVRSLFNVCKCEQKVRPCQVCARPAPLDLRLKRCRHQPGFPVEKESSFHQ